MVFLGLAYLFLLNFFASFGYAEPAWQELKGDHFIVYYMQDEAFAREVLRRSETYYGRIADELGYARASNFWQWENRVKIRIYPGHGAYQAATGQPGWTYGSANYSTKEIDSFSGCNAFLEGTLPHEITHLIFRDFVGFKGQVPLWLDEGVAQWQESAKRDAVFAYVRLLYDEGKLLPFNRLMKPDVLSGMSAEAAKDFYIQAASIVAFLVRRFGADSFIVFCRQLRDGKSLDEALRFAYPTAVRSVADLEKTWRAYVAGIRVNVIRHTRVRGRLVPAEIGVALPE